MNEAKFDGMGKIYAKYRPTYPQAFIDNLCSNAGIGKDSVIADIGSGTGILTKQLLELGGRVLAVEPNYDMRAVAETVLSDYENFYSINGTAESTTLESRSVDLITAAQAFHWFDRECFKTECKRILKPNGKVVLVWNSRAADSSINKDCDAIHRKYCPDFKGFSGGMRGTEDESDHYNDFFDGDYEVMVFQNDIVFDLEGFIGRNLSASYALKEGDANYTAYVAELEECFRRHAVDMTEEPSPCHTLVMQNNTVCYMGSV